MTILSADEFPGAERQPLAYPGKRPKFSYVYYQDKVYEITPRGNTVDDLWVHDSNGQEKLSAFLEARGNASMSQRSAVLAVGSNGCPGRLAEKYGSTSDVALPVLVGTLSEAAVVYSRTLVSYGALPATYIHQPGATSWLSVTLLTNEQLTQMDQTENIGTVYQRISIPGRFQQDGGPDIGNLTAYVDPKILVYHHEPVLLKMFARNGPDWKSMDEQEVLTLIFDEAGLLKGEPIELRHRQLMRDQSLRTALTEFLDTHMSEFTLDDQARVPF